MKKQWKVIPNYEDYKVSNFGEVKSYRRHPEGKLLKAFMLKNSKTGVENYYGVRLYSEPGVFKTFTVHSLVMLAFVGERPANMDIDHIKPDKKLNKITNLRYITPKLNVQKEQADDLKCIHVSGKSFFCKGAYDAAKEIGTYRMRVVRMLKSGKSYKGWTCKLMRKREK